MVHIPEYMEIVVKVGCNGKQIGNGLSTEPAYNFELMAFEKSSRYALKSIRKQKGRQFHYAILL